VTVSPTWDSRAPVVSQLAELVRLWGVTENLGPSALGAWPTRDGAPDVAAIAARYQLSATYLPAPPLAELRAIGLPALLALRGSSGEETYLLRRVRGDEVVLVGPAGEEIADGAGRLAGGPTVGAWILWRNVDQLPLDPLRELTPTVVATVALRLHKLGYLPEPLPRTYEPRVAQAVRTFQRAVGLPEDGLLGPRTTLALARVLAGRFSPTILADGQR
jgi:general secretion pathway protein A